jgi:uncharacterized membrane protein YhaH (DUF805 family)
MGKAKRELKKKLREEGKSVKNEDLEVTKGKLGMTPFIIAWLSYVPIFGIFFSLIAIMWALATEKEGKKRLSVIALIGFVYSVILLGIFAYMELQRLHSAGS